MMRRPTVTTASEAHIINARLTDTDVYAVSLCATEEQHECHVVVLVTIGSSNSFFTYFTKGESNVLKAL
jgi:hypothetical protein